ncbi:hypothetical protein [Rhizobium sp. SL86]|uniref:hypothetical protein n=1 Tax=Rhizobium sp. SL86 TaxID=2995148 RepID=UPI0022728FA9|nr:hypothetical protein [Rhizobium sp. SL86]MCY1666685.1 hypothetical protein [Rhizobium sp. SL86]
MLHSIACPGMGPEIVHHFAEGAAVWGQVITPSIAHLIQSHRALPIDFSRVRPGIVFEIETSTATLPHVIDASTMRMQMAASAFRHAAGRADATVDAVARIDLGGDCTLKVWGRVTAETQCSPEQTCNRDLPSTTSIIFKVTFWEIARASDLRRDQLLREAAEKDLEIQKLRTQAVLARCSQ